MPSLPQVAWILLAAVNVVSFLAFGWDKWRAVRGGWRVPEKTLIGLAAALGAPGAWAGLKVFRHKSSKRSFQWKLVGATLVNVAAVAAFVWLSQRG